MSISQIHYQPLRRGFQASISSDAHTGPSGKGGGRKSWGPPFTWVAGRVRAAVRAFAAPANLLKSVAAKAVRLLFGRSDATPPRAASDVFQAKRHARLAITLPGFADASSPAASPIQRLRRAEPMPEAALIRWRGPSYTGVPTAGAGSAVPSRESTARAVSTPANGRIDEVATVHTQVGIVIEETTAIVRRALGASSATPHSSSTDRPPALDASLERGRRPGDETGPPSWSQRQSSVEFGPRP